MKLKINKPITDQHFKGTFIFPDDLDYLGIAYQKQDDVKKFNDMVRQRIDNKKNKYHVSNFIVYYHIYGWACIRSVTL